MDINAPGGPLVQLADGARAAVYHHFTEGPAGRRFPAWAMGDDDMREIEQLTPAVPIGQAEECVHAQQQTKRAIGVLTTQLREGVDRV